MNDESTLQLTTHRRAAFVFFVKSRQKPALLTVDGFDPLNLNTCVTDKAKFFAHIITVRQTSPKTAYLFSLVCSFYKMFLRNKMNHKIQNIVADDRNAQIYAIERAMTCSLTYLFTDCSHFEIVHCCYVLYTDKFLLFF